MAKVWYNHFINRRNAMETLVQIAKRLGIKPDAKMEWSKIKQAYRKIVKEFSGVDYVAPVPWKVRYDFYKKAPKNVTKEEYEQIQAAEKGTKDKRLSRQLKALMLRYEGKKNPEIAEKLDISTDRISHIVSQYKREGLEEFMRVKYTGHNWNMSYEEEQAILDTFAERAEAGQIITVKEIKAVFDEKLGRDTGRGYIYMLLARHKWRKIKPRPKHPERASDEEIAASKKLKPSWKKSS